ncbi:MAG TPA: hypothetical protein VJ739_12800 [Gemmataceae bacterium]|nr:hypothetical protein [Gemmataceae bacterium]
MLTPVITDSVGYGKLTKTAGTLIQQLVRPFHNAKTVITGFKYTAAGTAHTGTVRLPVGSTTLSAAAAASQAVITLSGQPTKARNVATSDILVVERVETASGYNYLTWEMYNVHASTAPVVNSDGTITVTLAANVTGAHLKGQKVWLMALDTDTIPGYNQTPPKYTLTASAGTELPTNALAASGGLMGSFGRYEPLIWESNNATAAGTLEYLTAVGMIPAAAHA